MLRILIADDHPVVRRYVRELLESEEDWEVCAEAANGLEAVAMTSVHHPDIVVLDLSMPELDGLQAARKIHEMFPKTGLLIFTMHDPHELMEEVKAFGVRTCMLKTDLHQVAGAVRSVWQQSRCSEIPYCSQTAEKEDGSAETLTGIEQQIVQMLAQARNNREIASALSLTVGAVEIHRAAIMCKLKIDSVYELVRYAVRKKLIETKSTPLSR
jgi:DNA-binding NarL/FixJ family response regulator